MNDHNQERLKDVIEDFFNAYGLKEQYLQNRIICGWQEIMGPMVARHTNDLFIKGNKLFLYLDSAPLRHELTMIKAQVIKKVNEAVGVEMIKELIIK